MRGQFPALIACPDCGKFTHNYGKPGWHGAHFQTNAEGIWVLRNCVGKTLEGECKEERGGSDSCVGSGFTSEAGTPSAASAGTAGRSADEETPSQAPGVPSVLG